jgi:hypothetical protein
MAEVEVFKIDIQPVVSELAKLGSELEKARANYQETKKAQGEYSEDAIRAKSEVNVLSKEVNALTNVLTNQQKGLGELKKATEANIDITKIQNNTIETNRKLYNALYNQQLRNPSEQVAKQVKALSDKLKEQEGLLGNNTRKVGDYAGGFKDAIKELKLFGVSTGDIAKGLDAAKTGFAAAGGGVKGFSAALATTGLPLVIMAIQKLTEAFEQFKPVADAVESTITALKDGFSALISGGSILEAVSQGQKLLQTIRDLEDTQKAFNIQNKEAENQIDKLIVQSKNRTLSEKERIGLIDQANEIEEKAFKESRKRIDDELNQRRISFAQKNDISQKELIQLIKGTSDEALQLRERLEKNKAYNESDLELIQELFLKKKEKEGESLVLQEKLENRRAQLLEASQAEQEKRNAKAEAARDKADQAEVARLQKLEALETEFQLTEREKLKKSFEDELKTIQGNGERERLLRLDIVAAQEAALKKFDEDAEKKRQENQKRIESEIIANNAKAFNDKIAFNQKQLELELGAVDLSVASEKEKERRKAEIQLTALEEQLRLTKEFLGPDGRGTNEQLQGIKVIEQAIAKAKENLKSKEGDATLGDALGINEEATKEAQKSLEEVSKAVQAIAGIINMVYETRLNNIDNTKNAEIDAINQSTASEEEKAIKIQKAERDAANAKYQIQLKQFQANKATSIIQTIINTAQAVIAQFANPVPFAGAILSALAAATGAAQIAVIASQPAPPKPAFATGVIGLEGAGTATSDSIDAKLSRGESVITARATERFAPILAQMELAVGNRPNFQMGNKRFATGFIPTGDGGYSTRNAGSDLMARNATEKAMMQAVSAMPAQKLVLEEFRNFETNVDKSVAISEL